MCKFNHEYLAWKTIRLEYFMVMKCLISITKLTAIYKDSIFNI